MSRSVPEWIGASADTKVPNRVRLRVFQRYGGICQLSKRKIVPGDEWDIDHEIPLIQGGENRESNLRPVLRTEHREKTRSEVQQRAKEDRVRKKHLGIHKPASQPIPGSKASGWKRKMDGTMIRREAK